MGAYIGEKEEEKPRQWDSYSAKSYGFKRRRKT
jgi:hypothetical protein